MPALLEVGITHRNAPLAMRERLTFPPARAAALLRGLVASGDVDEAVVVSTCNRTELYVAAADPPAAERAALRALARRAGLSSAALRPWVSRHDGLAAVRHLFEVAAGLQSMILGEAQILGQLRRAHELARAEGACGPVLDRLLRDAVGAGRRARAATGIGRSGVSVSSAAVELARATLGSLADRRVLLVGAGESSELTARALAGHGVRVVHVANRGHERAVALARRYGAAVPFAALEDELVRADLVLSATASADAVIDRDAVARAMARRGGRRLVLFDLAVPRDVDAAVRSIPGVTLLDLDDIERRIAANRSARRRELEPARAVVRAEAERFERWRAAREAAPTVAALQGAGEAIVRDLLAANAPHWEALTAADRARVEAMARAVARRLLHAPTLALRAAAQDG
ncbi:MAG TPA: glutamyl-tRNA reductase, partial [Solirubrobacteraceae bacterium]|nr:glutamyl-tRNA reductase [Solirubrobacteraceae bacterium]